MVENMLDHENIEVQLGIDYLKNKTAWKARLIISYKLALSTLISTPNSVI